MGETIAKRIPDIVNKLNLKMKDILIELSEEGKNVIVLQYQKCDDIKDKELFLAVHNSIKYYHFTTMKVVLVLKGVPLPQENSIVKCTILPMPDALDKKLFSADDLNKSKKGTYFIASAPLSKRNNNEYFNFPFFKQFY